MSAVEYLEPYILLLTQFKDGEITATQLEVSYLELFKKDTEDLPEGVFNTLNDLFSDVDAYCGDPELRDVDDLDDDELMNSAKHALQLLSCFRIVECSQWNTGLHL